MGFTTPYARTSSRLGELFREQREAMAETTRRQGDISAQAWGNVGNTIGNTLSSLVKLRQDEPIRKQQLEMGQLQLGEARAEAATRTRQSEDAGILRSAQSSGMDPETVKAQLKQLGRGDLVPIYEKASNDLQASRLAVQKSKDERAAAENDYFGGIAAAIKAANFDPLAVNWGFQQAEADGHDTTQIKQMLQQKPDSLPAIVEGLIQKSPTHSKLAGEAADRALKTLQEQRALEAAKAVEADRKADNKRQDEAAAESRRHNAVSEAQAAATAARTGEPLEAVIDPATGKSVLRRRSQAEGMTPATTREQATEDERKTAGFHTQMKQAIAIIDELEGKLTQDELYQMQSLPHEDLIGLLNRNKLSENAKRYFRAFEQFTESRLRPVSGAAIADSEYARDRRTYAKQYGETPKLAEDRKRARMSSLESLKTRAGRALPKDEPKPDANQFTDLGGGYKFREKK